MAQELLPASDLTSSEGAQVSMLGALLAMTSDAVLVFDEDGTIIMANDAARRLFSVGRGTFIGKDVRALFGSTQRRVTEPDDGLEASLPFTCDGVPSPVILRTAAGPVLNAICRCERTATETVSYLMCLHAQDAHVADELEHSRLLDELSRANRRLAGTLKIVLGTLDSLDVQTLLEKILKEMTSTLDASAALAYVAEVDGYRLKGYVGDGTYDADVEAPVVMSYDHPLMTLVSRRARSCCLSVNNPTREELREGALRKRSVVDAEDGIAREVAREDLMGFATFILTPVWFGGNMIALLVSGWRQVMRPRTDDLRLLDAVAEYLSVQLAGAFAALRAAREERLNSLSTTLRERLLAGDEMTRELVDGVFAEAAEALEAELRPLDGSPHQKITMARLENGDVDSVPVDLRAEAAAHGIPAVYDVTEIPHMTWWVGGPKPRHVMICLIGEAYGMLRAFLFIRDDTEVPFDDKEVSFLRRLCEDVVSVERGEQVRSRDKHISQALMSGMRNELQEVEGLSAESRYSSATEAAYVGGDFYDLVRLPNRRAAVVMGDVSGKGIEAASVSSAVKCALSAYAFEGLAPARMVELLNDFLLGFSRLETFATMFVGIVDISANELTYCSAGHPPALLVSADTRELVTLGCQSGVVGAFAGMDYRDGRQALKTGDILVLYTDGVTEARAQDGSFFGEDGLRELVAHEVAVGFAGLADRLLAGVAAFTGQSLEDDVAIVVVRFDD